MLYNQQTSTNKIRFTPALSEAEGRYEMRTMNYWHLTTGNWRLTTSHELPATRSARTSAHKKTFLCKTNPISPDFAPKTAIWKKNKPNSKPIQSQSNPIQTQFQPTCTENKPNSNPISTHLHRKQTQSNPIKPIFKADAPKTNPISTHLHRKQTQSSPNMLRYLYGREPPVPRVNPFWTQLLFRIFRLLV